MQLLILIVGVIGAYLLGSISSAILVSKILRLPDPRTEGSGNPGATNVLRIGGKGPAILVLLGDVAKGWLPVMLVKYFTTDPWIISSVLLAAVMGHIFPLFFQFKGGKGVATAVGGLLGLSLTLGSIFIFTWLGIFALTRYSSLSALIAISAVPLFAWGFLDKRYAVVLALLALVIIWRHRSNVKRLLEGKEEKSSFSSKRN
ncbi:glycerol-3-phosphate 1-O-acyltransferase PlsY [Candidatus Berkiella aquae]|uniref:Glycerol-3-phosphate acyltransferase n=1 Tax=Candidatus Berkiella aquae TaxID=295108 RepID=A0A0Q9YSD4_9GAMM|nr:glycerol-3-phosphate 1-O-acyltransferase PlsY [Candidatus Berkiella aquae]MCS5709861.1 glycerol-3-phosphate 1-O-acyltransferase PlsY [Candidatus Berkiella aquae]